jgi:peptidoglycan/LPS O-acetylase OafA/YrhL
MALLFIKVAHGTGVITSILSHPVARYLGTISYSFYLYHAICITFVAHRLYPTIGVAGHDWLSIILLAPLSFGLAVVLSKLSYKWFEAQYFRRRHSSPPSRSPS